MPEPRSMYQAGCRFADALLYCTFIQHNECIVSPLSFTQPLHPPSPDETPDAATPGLEALLQRSDVWQARQARAQAPACQPTGHPVLDAALHGSGWPLGGLTELVLPRPGIGEIALLAPALRHLQSQAGLQLWIDPPVDPYPPALQQAGLALPQTVIVRPQTTAQWLWSCEQALRSGTCSALLCWAGRHRLPYAALRKLQVAAAEGRTLLCLMQATTAPRQPATPGLLRLQLEPAANALRLTILKQRGAPAGQQLEVALHASSNRAAAARAQAMLPTRLLPSTGRAALPRALPQRLRQTPLHKGHAAKVEQ